MLIVNQCAELSIHTLKYLTSTHIYLVPNNWSEFWAVARGRCSNIWGGGGGGNHDVSIKAFIRVRGRHMQPLACYIIVDDHKILTHVSVVGKKNCMT